MQVICFIPAKGKRLQPSWSPPAGGDVPQLRLYNSLTRAKVGLLFGQRSAQEEVQVRVEEC